MDTPTLRGSTQLRVWTEQTQAPSRVNQGNVTWREGIGSQKTAHVVLRIGSFQNRESC